MTAAQHTGPWELDTIRNDGEYGDGGPDPRSGFNSFAVMDAQGRVLFDSLNRDGALTEVHEEGDSYDGHFTAWDEGAKRDLTLAAAAPELLEALTRLMELERRGRFMPIGSEWDAARAAIAKATGSAA